MAAASNRDSYADQAKASWGSTPEYKEFEEKAKGRTEQEEQDIAARFMLLFKEAGAMKEKDPASPEAQALVKKIQTFITEHYYTCSDEVLNGLGKLYGCGGDFTKNIDTAGGEGTGAFMEQAIRAYCR
jgi:hypothetical protein